MGMIPFEEVVAYSRNVGAARVAAMLGKTVDSASASLYATWTQLGIGQPTGVDLAGELPGSSPTRPPTHGPPSIWRTTHSAKAWP